MFTNNPFAELSASISPSVQQTYIIVMVILVVVGTVYDTLHKKSAVYFWNNSIAIKTAIVDVAASGEFCSAPRRIAHLLTMYGFLAYAIATAVMVFWYPTPETTMPAIVAQLWHIGALMVCLGGYWFWFFIRVDVAAEGSSPFRIMRADLFILSLLMSATFALVWAYLQATDNSWAMAAFGLHIIATTVLFGSVAWSKFAHMFFKPAAAFEKRVSAANGSRSNLPPPADKPESFGSAGYQPRNY
jgi:predicted small integral membrane protein